MSDTIRALRALAIIKLGSKCARCGIEDERVLQIDHVHGNGFVEKKMFTQKEYLMKVIDNQSGDYQLLCANCNHIKQIENNEWYVRYNPKPRIKLLLKIKQMINPTQEELDQLLEEVNQVIDSEKGSK